MTRDSGDSAPGLRVRPYALTRGRTRPTTEVAIETLLVTTPKGTASAESCSPEERIILEEAAQPVSLAEIAARAHLMIGVAKVLVGDLVSGGKLTAQNGAGTDRPDVKLLERVLDGLKAL